MTKSEFTRINIINFAEMLNGRKAGAEIDRKEEEVAEVLGFVVMYGKGDSSYEMRGAISAHFNCAERGRVLVGPNGIVSSCVYDEHSGDPEQECEKVKRAKAASSPIDVYWCDKQTEYTWSFKTNIPHATFCIRDGAELFCEGIVFALPEAAGF
ncbi:MAG: hypothetical protein RR415_06750 [Ruthenibacterium sp.]